MLPARVLQSCLNDRCSSPLTAWSRLPELFSDVFEGGKWSEAAAVVPVDVRQEGDTWIIQAEVPGMSRDDVNITVENNVLTLSGKRASETSKEDGQFLVRERRTGEFSRSFRLPETADTDKVGAELAAGVLTLTIPTREEAKPRRIEVK
jgi:HSP20 family protein